MCLCGTNGWIRVIAIFQIILHATSLVLIFVEGVHQAHRDAAVFAFSASDHGNNLKYVEILLRYVLPVVTNAVGLVMGMFLLVHRGLKTDKQVVYLRYWALYTLVLLAWFLLARYHIPTTKALMGSSMYLTEGVDSSITSVGT